MTSWISPMRSASCSGESLARDEVPACSARADLPECERRDHRGDDAELHLAERKLRRRLGDDDVATRDEAAAAAERMTLHAPNHRSGAGVDRVEHRAQAQRVGDVLVVREVDRRAHPLDVRSGGERGAVARQNHGARVTDVRERCGQVGDQRGVESVAPFGPRHRDAEHLRLALDLQSVKTLDPKSLRPAHGF